MTNPCPRILLTTRSFFHDMPLRRTSSMTGQNYSEAVVKAGGLPFMVGNLAPELAERYLDGIGGVLFTGGGDIDPAYYGEEPHTKLEYVETERDVFEFALYLAARARGLPILGICRGVQLMNVAEGGSLHQDLPSLSGTLQHAQSNRGPALSHSVTLEPGSRLARALEATRLRSNSFHHHAVDRLGSGLRAVGRAADGVVEALEGEDERFLLGVQWHPEMSYLEHPEHFAPFRLLLGAVGARTQPEAVVA
ncbi:gamma-glutamyl-gamma-aminobutyrate hydrolase family protein [soil metagenome]